MVYAVLLFLFGGQIHVAHIPFDDRPACQAAITAIENLARTNLANAALGGAGGDGGAGAALGRRQFVFGTCVARGSAALGSSSGHQHQQGQHQLLDQQQQ